MSHFLRALQRRQCHSQRTKPAGDALQPIASGTEATTSTTPTSARFRAPAPRRNDGACWQRHRAGAALHRAQPRQRWRNRRLRRHGVDSTARRRRAYCAGGSPEADVRDIPLELRRRHARVVRLRAGRARLCEAPWLSPCAGERPPQLPVRRHLQSYADRQRRRRQHPTSNTKSPSTDRRPARRQELQRAAGSPRRERRRAAGAGGSARRAAIPSPVAAAAILSQHLKNALHKGLVVGYSVNEQVAGHFEVLLSRSIAKRLGISGAPAEGLPAGTARTARDRESASRDHQGRAQLDQHPVLQAHAARLAHPHKVSLMLRLIVRNAASTTPPRRPSSAASRSPTEPRPPAAPRSAPSRRYPASFCFGAPSRGRRSTTAANSHVADGHRDDREHRQRCCCRLPLRRRAPRRAR